MVSSFEAQPYQRTPSENGSKYAGTHLQFPPTYFSGQDQGPHPRNHHHQHGRNLSSIASDETFNFFNDFADENLPRTPYISSEPPQKRSAPTKQDPLGSSDHSNEATVELERSLQRLELYGQERFAEMAKMNMAHQFPAAATYKRGNSNKYQSPPHHSNQRSSFEHAQRMLTPPRSRDVSFATTDTKSMMAKQPPIFLNMTAPMADYSTEALDLSYSTQPAPLGRFADYARSVVNKGSLSDMYPPKPQPAQEEKTAYKVGKAHTYAGLDLQDTSGPERYYQDYNNSLARRQHDFALSFQPDLLKSIWSPSYGVPHSIPSGPRDPPTSPRGRAAGTPSNIPCPTAPQGFRPMQAITHRNLLPNTSQDHLAKTMAGMGAICSKFSTRYHGMHNETNASAEHIGDAQNCAIWLTNLPPDITYTELLRLIMGTGRIWCTYINEPDYISHKTAAAKVVYFTPDAAQRLLAKAWTIGISLRGHTVKAAHNRIKTEAHPVIGKTSRVLIITGSDSFATEENLAAYFKNLFIFQLDSTKTLIREGGVAVMEWRFGSYRCQAQMGKMALEKDKPEGFLKVEFGDDPCEVGDGFSGYAVALERIQGRGL